MFKNFPFSLAILFFFTVLFSDAVFSQSAKKTSDTKTQKESGESSLPSGYGKYSFGDSIETVRDAMSNDPLFLYEGEPDVTMVEPPDRTTLGVAGRGMLLNGFFVFYQEKLYEIILEINPERLDYFALYTQLNKKYGEAKVLNPQRALWETEGTILSLERSLFVKYVDRKTFDEVKEKMDLMKSYQMQSREDFLDGL